jgi:hypothetical protein
LSTTPANLHALAAKDASRAKAVATYDANVAAIATLIHCAWVGAVAPAIERAAAPANSRARGRLAIMTTPPRLG